MIRRSRERRFLAAVLFTDIVGSTDLAVELGDRRWRELLARHNAIVRSQLKRFGGREIDTAGDGFFASFDSPASAIRCACAASDGVRALGIEIRAGIHIGECEQMGKKVGGVAVHTAARILAAADPGEVLLSGTTKELVGGAGLRFVDRGVHLLKGVPGEWRLFAVDAVEGEARLPPADPEAAERLRAAIAPAPLVSRRIPLIVGVVGLAAAAVVTAILVTRRAPIIVPQPNTASRIDARSHRFAQTIGVGIDPIGVAAGNGGIWIINSADRTVTRLDGDGRSVRATKATLGVPTGIAAGEAGTWITTGFGTAGSGQSELLDFDSASNDVAKAADLPSGTNAVAAGDGFVWVADAVRNVILQINPKSHVLTATIPVGKQPVAIAVEEGARPAVWVANKLDHSVSRIDPSSRRTTVVKLVSEPTGIAVGATGIWVSAGDNTVVRLDRSSGTTIATIEVPSGPTSVAVGRDGVWVACSTAGVLVRIDPRTSRVVQQLSVKGSPTAVAADPAGDLWVTVAAA